MDLKFVLYILIFSVALSQSLAQGKYATEDERWFERASDYYDQEDFVNALPAINKSIELNPYNYEAFLLRGRIHEAQKQYNKAVFDYTLFIEKAKEEEADIQEALFSRAQLFFHIGRYADALHDFKALLKTKSGSTNVILYRHSQFEPGIDRIMSAASALKDYYFYHIGRTYLALNNPADALLYFDSAIYLNTKDADYYYYRGYTQQLQTNIHKAKENYSKCLSLQSTHPLALSRMSELGDDLDKLSILNLNIESNPGFPYAYIERASIYMSQNEWRKALDDYNKAIELSPYDSDYYVYRAYAKEKVGYTQEALADYDQSLVLDASNATTYLHLGNYYNKLKKYELAIEYYSTSLVYNPEQVLPYYNRAIAFYYAKQYSQACADIQRAKALNYQVDKNMEEKMCKSKP